MLVTGTNIFIKEKEQWLIVNINPVEIDFHLNA